MLLSKWKLITVGILVLFLIVISSFATVVSAQGPLATQSNSGQYGNHSISALNTNYIIDQSILNSSTQGQMTVQAFQQFIIQNLLQFNIRTVLLDIGWQNYAVGTIPLELWVNNWLTACDILGVKNVILLGQLTNSGIGSAWVNSLLQKDPGTMNYFPNGYVIVLSNDVRNVGYRVISPV